MKKKLELKNLRPFLHSHYHWIVAAVMLFMLFVYGGVGNNLSSLHIIPVTAHLGITRADFTLAFSAKTVAGMLSTFFSGFLISRMGSRLSSTLGLLVSVGAYLLLAFTESVWMLSLAGGLLGLTAGFCSTSAASHITRIWFHRHAGTVLGLITAATGIGGSVMCIIQTAALERGSFRASFLVCAVSVAIAALLVILFIRNDPKEKGLLPLGEGDQITGKRRKSFEKVPSGLPMKTLWTRPAFYLMFLCTFLLCFCIYMAFSSVRPYLVDCGFPESTASGFHSAMLLILTATKILVGFCSDHLGARRVNLICIVLAAVSLATLAMVRNFATALLAVVLYTCALPMVTIGTPLIAFSLFGPRAQTQYTGIFLGIITVSNFFGDYASNLIYSLAGSYRPAFWAASALAVLTLFLYLILYRLADKDLRRPDAQ